MMEIAKLKQDLRILNMNNVQLIQLNEYLSEKMGKMANVLTEKSKWDKQVAEKIRELDTFKKEVIYESTNQNVPHTIHGMP